MYNNYFDKIADKYDSWYQSRVGKYVDLTEKIQVFSLLKDSSGIVLDLGCGTGNYTVELFKRSFKVIGCDVSKEMLRIAKNKLPEVVLIRANAYKLPFKKDSFDIVLSITMFEFIKNPEEILKEVYRILKPGGKFILGTMNQRSLWFIFKKLKSLFVETAYRYANFYTPGRLKKLCLRSGFRDVQTRGVIYFPSFFPFLDLAKMIDEKLSNTFFKHIGAFVLVSCVKE